MGSVKKQNYIELYAQVQRADCTVPLLYALIAGKRQQANDNDSFVQNTPLFGSG